MEILNKRTLAIMRTRIHETQADSLPALTEAWTACLAASPSRQELYTFEWYLAWLRATTHRPPWTGQSIIVEVDDEEGRPVAFLPLAERRERGIRILSLAGFYQPLRTFVCATDHMDDAPESIADALDGIRSRWDVLRLDPFDTEPPERAALVAALRRRSFVRMIPRGRTIVNPIDKPYEAFAAEPSAKRIRSYEKRFLRDPANRIAHYSDVTEGNIPLLLDDLGTIESNSWLAKTGGGTLRFVGHDNREFWTELLSQTLCRRRQFHAWVAYVGSRPAAFRVVLTAGSTAYMIANQYDEAFSELRLGWILSLQHLKQACEEGVRTIDSAPGDLHYKGRLGGIEAEMRYGVYVFSPTARGMAARAMFTAIARLQEWLSRSPRTGRIARLLPKV